MTQNLLNTLFTGPLDIVGDVHGEIDPLMSLMHQLGYKENGQHPDDRRLIFVGDLTDRGPDSLAVVQLVKELLSAERAQCVLGNHELNLLMNQHKYDNRWFYGQEFSEDGYVVPQKLANPSDQKQIIDFFQSLPIALRRDDLQVVHACWDADMVEHLQNSDDVLTLHDEHVDQIENSFDASFTDPVDQSLAHQNMNPIKLLTSGPEERIEEPVYAAGKWRNEQRVSWWTEHEGTFCVFGHYSIPDGKPRGNASSFCIDYGVGKRWTERRAGKTEGFDLKLAALRWPEKMVVFDEGQSTLI